MSNIFGGSAKAETSGAPSASTAPTSTVTPTIGMTDTDRNEVRATSAVKNITASRKTSSTPPQATVDIKAALRDLAEAQKAEAQLR